MLGAKYAPKVLPEPAVPQASTGTTPQKPNGPIRIRKVVDGMFAKRHDKAPEPLTKGSQNIEAGASHSSLGARSGAKSSNLDAFALSTVVTNKSPTPPSSPVPHDKTLSRDRAGIDAREIRDATASPQSEAEPSSKVRRTSRKRKPTLPSSDVFGTVVTRPLQPRKRAPTSTRSDSDGFQGMSAVALKALTSSNTTKNQHFSVKLETKVVRKEGIRPESPTMKARTILQKQREEKDKQRKDRAARRARRSEDGPELGDADAVTESGDRSAMESDDDENSDRARLGKHRRGPGDEEDYETPERISRPVKRLKCVDGEGQVEVQKKQVKWDRGLSTTIYLDELHPKPKTPSMNRSTRKGCLTPAVKALRLDTLGNIMNANTPLTDLVHENITVTKFVYDNDQEAQPEVDTIPVKITRSKSKKAKS
ncbi:hypothetical protein SERLADRAFT_480710 [Serpula lacrymans var. lacrymans S7.9]|nr:uncharacterized protein SERLADRAFT_480710 [Serpula lacrymans var. lacrymans S7.9]EGO18585.1 hypothetical protein SERLADRAFT_480710 [Serpula lacrymans var. lacrymans S7.9]